jgi:hypothetical protein
MQSCFTDKLGIACVSSRKHESGFLGLAPEDSIRLEGLCEGLKVVHSDKEVRLIYITQCRLVGKKDKARVP